MSSQTEFFFEQYETLTQQLAAAQPAILANGQTLSEVFPELIERVRELRETLRVLDPENEFGW